MVSFSSIDNTLGLGPPGRHLEVVGEETYRVSLELWSWPLTPGFLYKYHADSFNKLLVVELTTTVFCIRKKKVSKFWWVFQCSETITENPTSFATSQGQYISSHPLVSVPKDFKSNLQYNMILIKISITILWKQSWKCIDC